MGLTLKTPPGFADLADSVLVAGNPALGIEVGRIYDNAVFGLARTEVFLGIYKNGDTVALPISPVDGYAYSRDELIYFWTVRNSTDPSTLWISGADSLFFCEWLVEQSTGIVHSDEWYRRSGAHADVVHTNDGKLEVWTVGQRQLSHLILASSPTYAGITGSTVAQDKPFTQLLAQSLNDDAKFAVLNHEVFYLGEYYNGQTVTMPTSPADGYAYSSGECKFLFSWRWTAQGNLTALTQPALSNGQLGPIKASVNSSGVVSTTIEYIDDSGNLNSSDNGRIAVFAFCQRSGTPGTITPAAENFAEISFDEFMPGAFLEYPTVQQMINNILQGLLTPEFFGPTTYANGDTISVPTSPIDGYVYSRSELSYLWSWSDTSNQTGSNLRLPLFFGHIDPTTGVVTLHVWRLPPGGPYVDDDDALARISVMIVARRQAQAPAAGTSESSTAPTGATTTGGNVVADVPTLSGAKGEAATGAIDGANLDFSISTAGTIVFLVWNGQVRFDFTQTSPTTFTTGFVANTNDILYAVYTI